MELEMKIHKMVLALLVSLLLVFSSALYAESPREIIREMESNMRGDAVYHEMSMETVRPRYTREISMRSWRLGDDYSFIYITSPARDEGTAFLKRGREMWNYQPFLDRVIKMPPSMMSQEWMGSDFTNDDLVSASSITNDYTHELIGSREHDGYECYVIDMFPEPETPVVYEKVRYWVIKDYRLPAMVENYGEEGVLENTIYFRGIEEMGGRRIPSIMEMVPADKENHKTVIHIKKADFDIDIGEEFFSIQRLTDTRR